MSGTSSWIILGPILTPWPYRLLIFGLVIVTFSLFARRGIVQTNESPIVIKRLAIALLGGQILAMMATIVFVECGLGWQPHPNPIVIEDWAGTYWHFYADDFFSVAGLGLSLLCLVWARDVTWSSIGVKRPTVSVPWILIVVAACYLFLHFAIRPISLFFWKSIFSSFGIHSNQGSGGLDLAQWEVWSLRQTSNQIGVFGPVLVVLWMGILAPIIEELFFRGLFLTVLSERGSALVALIVQALVFAAIHLDCQRLPYLIMLGLILGYLVRRTRSLLPSVLLHIVVNVLSLVSVLA